MNTQVHKPGIHENYLVNRNLKLTGVGEADIAALEEKLNALPQVAHASVTSKADRVILKIGYDASTLLFPLNHIQQLLMDHGAAIADDWWTQFKHRYYVFTDQNIYENARSEPHCCNKAPPGR